MGKARVASLTGWEWRLRPVAFICGEGTGAGLSWRRLVGAQGDGLVTTLAQRHGIARHNDDSALWVQRVRGVACGKGPSVFGSGAGRQAGGLSLVTCTVMMGTDVGSCAGDLVRRRGGARQLGLTISLVPRQGNSDSGSVAIAPGKGGFGSCGCQKFWARPAPGRAAAGQSRQVRRSGRGRFGRD